MLVGLWAGKTDFGPPRLGWPAVHFWAQAQVYLGLVGKIGRDQQEISAAVLSPSSISLSQPLISSRLRPANKPLQYRSFLSLSFVPLCQQHASEHLSFVSHTSGQQQLQSTDQLQCGRRVTSLNKQTIWLSEQDMTNACNSVVFKALNFATVTVRRSLSSRCNLAYPSRCSFGKIHMESRGKSDSRGALIVLEGLDRCGKTSQCARLHSYLVELGHAVELWRFPDRNTGVGQMISSYLANESNLDDHAVHLLFSANRWEKRSLMESKLRSGTTLIVDRYSFSGVAFSSAKGLDVEWCKAPEVGLLAPDVVVYLDISPEKAAERGGYGGERYEKLEFQKKVAQSYKTLCDSTWKMVDATLPIEDVEKQLRQIVKECMMTCQNGKPISELWQN